MRLWVRGKTPITENGTVTTAPFLQEEYKTMTRKKYKKTWLTRLRNRI